MRNFNYRVKQSKTGQPAAHPLCDNYNSNDNRLINIDMNGNIENIYNSDGQMDEIKKEKLKHYFDKNLDIMNNKLFEIENKLKIKYKRLSQLENFHNSYFEVMNIKTKERVEKLRARKNDKLTSKDIFFNLHNPFTTKII